MKARTRLTRSLAGLLLVPAMALTACSSDEPAPVTSASSSDSAIPSSAESSVPSSVPEIPSTTAEVPVTPAEPPAPPPPAPAFDPLTGGDPSSNVLIAVKIDNTFPGKQWGIASADVVYVEMVEGNLSRLIALFHTSMPEEVGPVRSVRTTDPDVLTAYGTPALMFSGGAGGPLDNFGESGLIDASPDAIGGAYWRSSAASEPYNLHANVSDVAAGIAGIGVPKTPGFTFADDYPALATQREVDTIRANFANQISFSYSDGHYNYIRRGSMQTDGANGQTFEFQNVLVQHVTADKDGTVDVVGSPSYKSNSIGSGDFTLYRDGRAVDGTWTRTDAGSATSYADASGAPVLFRPGKTWVVLAPDQIPTSEG